MNKRQALQAKINESLTPEEIIARSRRAKVRFRGIIKFVIQNLYWLDDTEDAELGDDVQKNILLLTRRKGKKGLLSLQDKGILNKRAEYRTDAEKLQVSRIISGLKCFRRYPMDVKNQLAGVTYFYYYGPGRTIVRQGHPSDGLYFIITGDVAVTQEFYDPVMDEMVSKDVGTMRAGDMFGEVALLHDIPRNSTVTTSTHVEVLCLKKEDFNVVLKATVQEQWEAVKNAMDSFNYFNDWDITTVRDCCILAKLKTFLPAQTILGDGYGHPNYVYFLVTGKCQVIEHLLVTSQIKKGIKCYKLYVPSPPVDIASTTDIHLPETEAKEEATASKSVVFNQSETVVKSIETPDDPSKLESKKSGEGGVTFVRSSTTDASKSQLSKTKIVEKISFIESQASRSSSPLSVGGSTDKKPSVRTTGAAAMTSSSKNTPWASCLQLPPYVETHFMQVCIFNPTACFNIGENMHHRRVLATTHTECLLIPRYWLLQQNIGNIWNRVRQFLSSHIPTTKQLFKEFVNQRKWLAHRKKIIDDIMSKRNKISNNNINNVPYFIRINEEIDL